MSCGINHSYKSFLSSHLAFRALSAHAFGWAPLNLGRRSRTASSPPRASGRTRGPAGVSRGRSIPKTLLVASAELSNGKNTVPLVSHMWNYMLIFVLNTDECLLDDLMGGPVHLHLYTTLKNFTEMQAGQQTCFRCCIMLHHHQRLAFTNTYMCNVRAFVHKPFRSSHLMFGWCSDLNFGKPHFAELSSQPPRTRPYR